MTLRRADTALGPVRSTIRDPIGKVRLWLDTFTMLEQVVCAYKCGSKEVPQDRRHHQSKRYVDLPWELRSPSQQLPLLLFT
jgi:hypothetical protein